MPGSSPGKTNAAVPGASSVRVCSTPSTTTVTVTDELPSPSAESGTDTVAPVAVAATETVPSSGGSPAGVQESFERNEPQREYRMAVPPPDPTT